MPKIIPDRPPAVFGEWERRHREPWHLRWHHLFGVMPDIQEHKIPGARPHNSRLLSAAKAKTVKSGIDHSVDTNSVVGRNGFRSRAQIPDVCLGDGLD